ncbi:hypothetical protein ACJ2A9_01445 [Anaerobacillus sp. MEB173]|uniref:hypothetical protein n=1 Tax=Anaerobacillus sp. MEB173 TaxID=3383345 RepID=UPI003F915FAA
MAISTRKKEKQTHTVIKKQDSQDPITHKMFCCPENVPVNEDDGFCLPCNCPEQIPQPKFPSPNTAFSPQEFVEIKKCIEQANELLLALANDDDDINERALQLSLRKLRKLTVVIIVKCGVMGKKILGRFLDAGKDFIVMESVDTNNIMVIITDRVLSIHFADRNDKPHQEQELINIDPCFRRNLTFHFSEVVTRSPFLLNLFFGLDLSMFLESYVGYYCYVKTNSDEHELTGTFVNVRKRSVVLEEYGEKQAIDFDEMCIIELEK